MPGEVLILGAAGNFGKRIAGALTRSAIPVILAGRTRATCAALHSHLSGGLSRIACFDAHRQLDDQLDRLRPALVVNTCGPFQGASYAIAETCIAHRTPYIDLADGREFVNGISALDRAAADAGIAVISGASTVPGLSSAALEALIPEFAELRSLTYGISPGQKAERGLATTKGILSYVGKPLKSYAGSGTGAYGWQGLYRQHYPGLGARWMANCDVPDLDLFPARYGLDEIRFSAGLELGVLHLGLWGLSWLVRAGLPLNLPRHAPLLLRAAARFDRMGTSDGAMHMILSGTGPDGAPKIVTWFIIARDGDGPHIPTAPAVCLAKQIVRGAFKPAGAMPCLGLVSLEDCLAELSPYNIQTHIVSAGEMIPG